MKHLKFNPGKERFRATFSAADIAGMPRFGKIDEAAGILHDVQVNIMGEAKGHGVYLGEDFIDAIVEQGNASQLGVKVRFGHPNMCSDALGTYLGRAKNFAKKEVARPDGTTCQGAFANIHLADEAKDAPSGDLHKWTLGAAKNSPDTFGQSIVFTYADFYVLDSEGNKHLWSAEPGSDSDIFEVRMRAVDKWDAKSVDGKRYAVLDRLLGTDFTDSPAATDGVFGTEDLAAQATEMLDANPRIIELLTTKPDTVSQFLDRYNAALLAAGKPAVCLSVVGSADELANLSTQVKTLLENEAALRENLLESEKRFSGLQSAKDKEIASLRAELLSANTSFTSQLAALQTGLDSAKAELSAALEEKAKTAQALGTAAEQLKAKETALAKLTGDVLTASSTFASWKDAEDKLGYSAARKQHPELYEAFMASAK